MLIVTLSLTCLLTCCYSYSTVWLRASSMRACVHACSYTYVALSPRAPAPRCHLSTSSCASHVAFETSDFGLIPNGISFP
ncbi:unnamed protein product [Periconia digitata]|uniref:Secreted protein n=1 Tax=Periconia digitata TaxID=1303443 RepID=A0A9W4UJQ0_9PLEO|nr:unnamed protein product [Periconia digitata]